MCCLTCSIVDRFGTKDVRYARVDDTHFSVTAKVEISDQFFGWILGFGKKAKLLYPDDVIDQFRAYMDKIREMYDPHLLYCCTLRLQAARHSL